MFASSAALKTEHPGHQIRMFVLIWATLLFSARGASQWGQEHCNYGFCITLIDGELTAEAGLCVVIPCSFTPRVGFMVQNIVWYKCEGNSWACTNGDPIFHSDNNINVQSEFKGRVSLLESDVSQKNCSIIINDLKESDSGSYQLRVNGYFNYWNSDGFTFSTKPTVSVKGLQKKPRVKIPTLTEGQQATLICIAPGLCSGSVPEITWTWTAAGGTESHITGNITALKTKNLTAVTQRHISTMTFNPSAEHHNTNVTCKTSFIGGTTTEETSTLNVNWFVKIHNGSGCVLQSEVLTCVCISEGFPLPTIKWPFLKNHKEYSVITTLSNHIVSSTVSLTVKIHGNTTIECVSNNENGEAREKLLLQNLSKTQRTEINQIFKEQRIEAFYQQPLHHSPGHHEQYSAVIFLTIAVISILVNVIFIIFIVFLWNSRKKVRSQEDRTYMSLQITDRSSEYDIVGHSLN